MSDKPLYWDLGRCSDEMTQTPNVFVALLTDYAWPVDFDLVVVVLVCLLFLFLVFFFVFFVQLFWLSHPKLIILWYWLEIPHESTGLEQINLLRDTNLSFASFNPFSYDTQLMWSPRPVHRKNKENLSRALFKNQEAVIWICRTVIVLPRGLARGVP